MDKTQNARSRGRNAIATIACVIASFGVVNLSYADHFVSGEITQINGETVVSHKIKLGSRGQLPITKLSNNFETTVKYEDIGIITVSSPQICPKQALLILRDGENFRISFCWPDLFGAKTMQVMVVDPINRKETTVRIKTFEITEVDFLEAATGEYRQAKDGRLFPSSYVYDPRTGEEMTLVGSPDAQTK